MTVFGSSLSESNLHTHDDLPILLAGNAGGRIKGNRHLAYTKETPLNNLFLNMFDVGGRARRRRASATAPAGWRSVMAIRVRLRALRRVCCSSAVLASARRCSRAA